jgi:hypothetical protein
MYFQLNSEYTTTAKGPTFKEAVKSLPEQNKNIHHYSKHPGYKWIGLFPCYNMNCFLITFRAITFLFSKTSFLKLFL